MRRFLPLLLVALAGAPSLAAAEVPASMLRLLAATDPFANAPEQARLGLVFTGANGKSVPLEIWRHGEERSLVRLLAEKDRGKFVVRRGEEVWLLTPGAREPVKMSRNLSPAGGAALDQLFALRIGRDYRAVAASEQNGVVTFDLEARAEGTDPPKVRWVVAREPRLPLRIEFRSADDRLLRMIEFRSWRDPKQLVPERLVAKDLLRGGAPLDVEILAVERREVPDELFDLEDDSARRALPPPLAGPDAGVGTSTTDR